MNFFESMRRANRDFYTANPAEFLSTEQLQSLAEQQGMTVAELKTYLTTPRLESTCPLCGQASTHLVSCTGCGGDAWGFETELAHGADAIDRLRQGLTVTLYTYTPPSGERPTDDQVQHAVRHAYQPGGCLVCTNCWEHTLPTTAYAICPLKLHAERVLHTAQPIPFPALLQAALNGEKAQDWLLQVFVHWTQHWNTAGATDVEQQAIANCVPASCMALWPIRKNSSPAPGKWMQKSTIFGSSWAATLPKPHLGLHLLQ